MNKMCKNVGKQICLYADLNGFSLTYKIAKITNFRVLYQCKEIYLILPVSIHTTAARMLNVRI